MKKIIGVFVGSLRKGSYSRSVAECVIKLAPKDVEMKIIEIGHLPIYNQDYDEANTPESYSGFRQAVKALDGVLFVTPEHNRSFPAALKNALDVASRPYGQNVWSGKPGGIISQSIGGIGGFGANHHLRQVTSFLNIQMLQQPECYLGNITNAVNEDGVLTCEKTIEFLQQFVNAYTDWVNVILKK